MATSHEWIWAALARDPSKTQTGLADALGVDKSAITKLKRGERQLKLDEAQKAAAYLGAPLPTGFSEEDTDFEPAPLPTAPIYSVSLHNDGFWRLDRSSAPVDRRAPGVGASVSVFGFYVPSEVMAPRFKIGEMAWVDPARPAAPHNDALLVEAKSGKGARRIFLCELVDIQEADFFVIQHGDDEERSFSRKQWTAFHVLARL